MTDDNSSTDTLNEPAPPQLLATELRVIGVLMEKQLTTPDQYPLTLNAIVTGCNQKSSRDPVSNYHQGEVQRCLTELENKKFVRKEYGSRTDKYTQQFIAALELGKKQQALLCIMMLRGPQTPNELFTRTQRMQVFSDKDELNHCIDRLCERELPYATRLGVAGQRGERIAHLFSGTPQFNASASGMAASSTTVPGNDTSRSDDDSDAISVLELDVLSLTEAVQKLERENTTLRTQMEILYRLTGHELPQQATADDEQP